MSLNAGQVYVLLGGKFAPGEFNRFAAATFKAKGDMERAEKGITASHARMTKAAKLGAAAVAGLAVGGAAIFARETIKAVGVAAQFDSELRRLAARSTITAKQLKQVRQASLDLGTSMGVGARQAAKASTELVKGGLSVQKLLSGGLKGALDLAVAGEMDVAQAAETVANALNLFKLRGQDATHVADALATAANATTADVSDFAIALTQGGAAAKTAGLSFDETVGFLEALAANAVKGSDAGTSMKSMLTQIASPTKQAAEKMKQLGLDFFDAHGAMKPLPAVAAMLGDKLGKLSKEQRLQAATTLAGTDGMRALLALYDAGPKQIQKFERGLKEQGTAAKVAAQQNEGAAGAARKLKASWEQAQIIVGEQLLPAIAQGADTLSQKLQDMAKDGSLKQMGDDLARVATQLSADLPNAIDKFTSGVGKIDDIVGLFKDLNDVMGALTNASGAGFLKLILDPIDTILKTGHAAVTALKLVAQAADAVLPGDQSRTTRDLDRILNRISIARKENANRDLRINFSIDSTQLDKIDVLAGRLGDIGKRKTAVAITTNADSAESAIAGLQLALKGVPEKRIVNIITRSQGAEEQVAAFTALANGVPPRRVTEIQTKSKTAMAAVLAFRALAAGVPAKKVTEVLAHTESAQAQINGVLRLIAAVPASKNTTITVTTRRIETLLQRTIRETNKSIKAKAAGGRTSGPQMYLVGEGSDPVEWIIPRDPQHRSRAIGLLMDAAKSILPGMAKGGKTGKPKPKARWVPPVLDHHAYSVTQFEDRETATQHARDKAEQLHKNLANARMQLRRAERMPTKTAKQKAARQDSIGQARRRIKGYEDDLKALPEHGNESRLAAILKERRAELAKAKRFQAQITEQEEIANLARDQMALADRRDDGAGYKRAQGDRTTALGKLKALLQLAERFALGAGNSDFARQLASDIVAADLGLEESKDAMSIEESPAQQAVREAAERLADTGMTDAERAQLAGIDKDIALAALTQTLEDDKTAAGAKVGFLERILGLTMTDLSRGGDRVIAGIAGDLRTARDNVASLAGGTAANENADLQAQIDQERARTAAANKSAEVDRAALAAFSGFRGAGAGGLAPVVHVYQQNLVPGSSDVLRRVGDAAAAGFDVQGYKRPQSVRVGL